MNEQRTIEQMVWTMVGVRLPEKNRNVLVADNAAQIWIASLVDHPKMGEIWRNHGGKVPPPLDYGSYTDRVIAWCPIPEFHV